MGKRHTLIDVTKGVLVVGMVFAHILQLLARKPGGLEFFSQLANIVSFSGFFFCFGFAGWLAYWRHEHMRWAAVLRTAFRCYAAFVVSGVAFRLGVNGMSFNGPLIWRILLLRDIPGYSEFLLAFPLALLAASVLRPLLIASTRTPAALALTCAGCLTTTFLSPLPGRDPLVGLWIGGMEFAYFPVIPYAPLFLLGVHAARRRLRCSGREMLAALGVAIICLLGGKLWLPTGRFPPSLVWVVGSAAMFHLYLGALENLTNSSWQRLKRYLESVGRHVLMYLVCSNLVIFLLCGLGFGKTLSSIQTVLALLGVMLVCLGVQRASALINFRRSAEV